MNSLKLAWAIPIAAAVALGFAACGGDSDDATGATATTDPAKSNTAGPTTADATSANSSSPADPDDSPEATTVPATTDSSTPAPVATPAPTRDPERVKAFTNGILGEAQEPLFWMQLITGDIECGTNCPDSLDARWNRAVTVCGEGRWESRKSEDGYDEEIHGPIIDALVESCSMLSAKYSAGGTPDDSDEWREVANGALNLLGPQFESLLESTLTAE